MSWPGEEKVAAVSGNYRLRADYVACLIPWLIDWTDFSRAPLTVSDAAVPVPEPLQAMDWKLDSHLTIGLGALPAF